MLEVPLFSVFRNSIVLQSSKFYLAMATAGVPLPLMALQAQAKAKLLPGGIFGPVAASSAAKHNELAWVLKKIEVRGLKIWTDPKYGAGSHRHAILDAEVAVLWFCHRYIHFTMNLP